MVHVRDKCMLTNNWAKEKWVPIDIKSDGKITDRMLKFIISDPQFNNNISNLNNNEKVDFDTYKLKSKVDADSFLKTGKLDLSQKKVEIEDPVFVHFEFDN